MNKTPDTMTRDEVRSAIALKVLAHVEAPRELNLYSDFFAAQTSTRAGRKNNFAIWTRGCAPELVAELRALVDRLDALDAASEAAAALGRIGGSSTSPAKRAASRANGAKGGRPATHTEDCYCSMRRGVITTRGYFCDGRFRVSMHEAARLVRVWELGTPDNLSEVYVLDDDAKRVPIWTR